MLNLNSITKGTIILLPPTRTFPSSLLGLFRSLKQRRRHAATCLRVSRFLTARSPLPRKLRLLESLFHPFRHPFRLALIMLGIHTSHLLLTKSLIPFPSPPLFFLCAKFMLTSSGSRMDATQFRKMSLSLKPLALKIRIPAFSGLLCNHPPLLTPL